MALNKKKTTVLAIETSCDETGVAILQKENNTISVLADRLSSQIDIHKLTGGVVPEIAAREHLSIIKPMIEDVLKASRYSMKELDAIAVTVGPGLMPALSVGVSVAKALSYAWNKPLVPVNHMEGHIYSALLSQGTDQVRHTFTLDAPEALFPSLALVVSGGHTLLIKIENNLHYEIIGTTRDDAAGEAFDKVARLLELPYPGGPHLSKLASTGDPAAFDFPRPMLNSGDYDFSFSGLKTAVLYAIQNLDAADLRNRKADIAASFERVLIDSLVIKVKRAAEDMKPQVLLLAGGVAANKELRHRLATVSDRLNVDLRIAPISLCGDNAVMIGQVGLLALETGRTARWGDIDAIARPQLSAFTAQTF